MSSPPDLERLVLGTAQLGMEYGVANRGGRPTEEEAFAMLDLALAEGIRELDTAQGYGDSERLIGRWIADRDARVQVITKLRPDVDATDRDAVERAVDTSRIALGDRLAGVLVHRPGEIGRWGRIAMLDCGLPLGMSVYEPEEFELAVSARVPLVQVPFNALDRRLDGRLESAGGSRIFLRSIYLQGLLVSDAKAPAGDPGPLAAWRALCSERDLNPAAAAIGFARASSQRAWLVIGAETVTQLEDTIRAWREPELEVDVVDDIRGLPEAELDLIDPRRWGL